MATDCRIAGTADFIIYAGETWQVKWNILDINNEAIDVAGFTVGPIKMYDHGGTKLLETYTGVAIEGSQVAINQNTSNDLKRTAANKHNYFECPLIPPGGEPIAIIHGTIQVYARK
jgi:hypothetical protein